MAFSIFVSFEFVDKMSCEFTIGLGQAKSSSRVLKPPGGASSDFFAPQEANAPKPRPKYDQQNSSNLNFVMNTTDPNILVQKLDDEHDHDIPIGKSEGDAHAEPSTPPKSNGAESKHETANGASPAADNLPKYHHHRSTNLW